MFSSRSSNYERLEGGMGPSRLNGMRFSAWKKFAFGAVVIIGLVLVFGPRKEDLLPSKCELQCLVSYGPSDRILLLSYEPARTVGHRL